MADKSIIKAAYVASVKHREQRRKDTEETPYINHPLALANVLAVECGVDDVEVICGALLHDTIEDTGTPEEELLEAFGEQITRIVLEVLNCIEN
jgi:guanosine-3',5'-bis(diphosphate) 3'-pyrophosphohydrolase